MKNFAKILLCMSCLFLLTCCEKEFQTGQGAADLTPNFIMEFTVETLSGNPVNNNDWCNQLWVGQGSNLVYGDFSVEISLKINFRQDEFCDLLGSISFIDGHDIFFSIPYGNIVCSEDGDRDYYQAIINNLAIITGGTGIFEKATGDFYPNAKIHNGEGKAWHAYFRCKGNLNLNNETIPPASPVFPDPSNEE